jgi:hypothetical protein
MADEGNKVHQKISPKTKTELDKLLAHPGTLDTKMYLQIYSVLYDS